MKKKLNLKNLTEEQKTNLKDGTILLSSIAGGYGLFKLFGASLFTQNDILTLEGDEVPDVLDIENSTDIECVESSSDDTFEYEYDIDPVNQDSHQNFGEAFQNARQTFGPGATFEYKGELYTTFYAEEVEMNDPNDIEEVIVSPLEDIIIDKNSVETMDTDDIDLVLIDDEEIGLDEDVLDEVDDDFNEADFLFEEEPIGGVSLDDVESEFEVEGEVSLELENEVVDFSDFIDEEFEDNTSIAETVPGEGVDEGFASSDFDSVEFEDSLQSPESLSNFNEESFIVDGASFKEAEFNDAEFNDNVDIPETKEGSIGYADLSDFNDAEFEGSTLEGAVVESTIVESVDTEGLTTELEEEELEIAADEFNDAEFGGQEFINEEPALDVTREEEPADDIFVNVDLQEAIELEEIEAELDNDLNEFDEDFEDEIDQ